MLSSGEWECADTALHRCGAATPQPLQRGSVLANHVVTLDRSGLCAWHTRKRSLRSAYKHITDVEIIRFDKNDHPAGNGGCRARKKNIDENRILDAAQQVVLKAGASALTLDMVAAEAHLRKGGLTYTFATKSSTAGSALPEGVNQRISAAIRMIIPNTSSMIVIVALNGLYLLAAELR